MASEDRDIVEAYGEGTESREKLQFYSAEVKKRKTRWQIKLEEREDVMEEMRSDDEDSELRNYDDSDIDKDYVASCSDSSEDFEEEDGKKSSKTQHSSFVGKALKGGVQPKVGNRPSDVRAGKRPRPSDEGDISDIGVAGPSGVSVAGPSGVDVGLAGPSGVGVGLAGPSGVDVPGPSGVGVAGPSGVGGEVFVTPRRSPRKSRPSSGALSSAGSSGGPGGSKQPGKKKLRLVSEWQVSKAKTARNLGLEYQSYKTKKIMPARTVGDPCSDGCFVTLGMEKIDSIFANFWSIGDINLANNYLVSRMTLEKYKRKYTKKQQSQKDVHVVFHVTYEGQDYPICRKAFMSIHGIGKKKVELMIAKKKKSAVLGTGTIVKDMRGQADSGKKIRGPQLDCVHGYIQSLPTVSSHYTRAKAKNRLYLPSGGNTTCVYNDYVRHMHEEHRDVTIVKEGFFRQIFNTKYNISFSPPATDVCNTCERLTIDISAKTSKGEDAKDMEHALESHKELARTAQDMLKEQGLGKDNEDGVRVIAIDLQQTLPVPKLPVNVAYYKTKLWLFNFCVYDITKNQPYMFMWDETQAARGPNEIGSCILKWLDMVAEQPDGDFTHLRIFADNCAGQNKNIYIILALLQKIQQKRVFRIEVIFLVSGHTYLPCDRAFGVIEKTLRKNPYICSVPNYLSLIRESCTKSKYEVVHMQTQDIRDIKLLEKKITNRSAGLKNARVLILTSLRKEGFYMMQDYTLQETPESFVALTKGKSATVRSKGRGRPKELLLEDIELPVKYPNGRVLKPKKTKDLEFLIPFLPGEDERDWVRSLVNRQKTLSEIFRDQQDDDVDDANLEEDPDNTDNILWEYVASTAIE